MEALKSALEPLKPLTNSLPAPIADLGVSIIGDTCYKTLILDLDPTATECVKYAISKGLGIGIIGASSIVKVPQIIKLLQSKSSSGISFLSYLLETSSYLISLAYNVRNEFPFSTYGETALILGQNVVITVLVLNYSGRATMAALFVAALAVGVVSLFSDSLLDMQTLSYLQAGAGVLGVASKVPQIAAIWQQGGTGQLSAFTVRLLALFAHSVLAPFRIVGIPCWLRRCRQQEDAWRTPLPRWCNDATHFACRLTRRSRSSTISPAPCPGSSRPCKRWTIS